MDESRVEGVVRNVGGKVQESVDLRRALTVRTLGQSTRSL